MKYTTVVKQGTTKTQLIETDRVEFYRQYGWEPVEGNPVKTKPAKPEPAVEQEVGNDIQGE